MGRVEVSRVRARLTRAASTSSQRTRLDGGGRGATTEKICTAELPARERRRRLASDRSKGAAQPRHFGLKAARVFFAAPLEEQIARIERHHIPLVSTRASVAPIAMYH